MKAPSRQVAMLVVLTTTLVGVLGYQLWDLSPAESGDTAPSRTPARGSSSAAAAVQVPPVQLEALQARHEVGATPTRDPFRFRVKPPPPPPPDTRPPTIQPVVQVRPELPRVPPSPSSPPITLKFLGFVMAPTGTRVAVLHDGTARPPLRGTQGDVIEGRYRLLRVDADAVEIAYLDGTGRRRINMTGQ